MILLLAAIAINSRAQEVPGLVTDRPDHTESASVVPFRTFQIEAGMVLEGVNTRTLEIRNRTYNTTLLRFGLLDFLELRAGLEHLGQKVRVRSSGETRVENGMGPFYTGVKLQVTQEQGFIPQIAFIGGLVIPFTASDAFRPEYTTVTFRFAFAHTLSDMFSIGYNLGADWDGDTGRPSFVYSFVFGASITDRFGAYIENYGAFPQHMDGIHQMDGGVTFLLLPNLQLDASTGIGLSSNAPDFFFSIGASYRIPR